MTKDRQTWKEKISHWTRKFFEFIQLIGHAIAEIIHYILNTITYFTGLILGILVNPNATVFVAVAFASFVLVVATAQWWQIGVWIGALFGLKGQVWGFGLGTLGMMIGAGINTYQLSPKLWKLDSRINKAYVKLGINPNHEAKPNDPGDRSQHRLSYSHAKLEANRWISYAMETSLVLPYCVFAGSLSVAAILQAAVSLIFPELSIALLAGAIEHMGKVGDEAAKPAAKPAGESTKSKATPGDSNQAAKSAYDQASRRAPGQ